jgi:hypothetical protein
MAQTGYTPILIYSSSTTTNAPAVGNLTNSTLGSELAINITDGKLFYKDNANAIQVIGWKVRPASAGGTGLTSFAVGDLLYADTTTTLAKLADVATGNALISGGVSVAPSWGKIGLTTHVSGILPLANGGTNNTTGAATAVTSNSTSGLMQITGPAAASTRVMTIPDANFTAARTDAAQTFNGSQTFQTASDNQIYINATGSGRYATINFQQGGVNKANIFYDHTPGILYMLTANGVQIDQNLIIGTSGKGIDFSATAGTGTSELLADYEEGTWTPTLVCGTSGTITLNSGFAGTYTKVGRQVTVCVTVYVDSVSVPVGSLRLNGLPYTCNSGNSFGSGAAIHGQTTLVPAGSSLDARVIAGEAAISIYAFTAGTVVNAASYVQATTLFTITCSYFV